MVFPTFHCIDIVVEVGVVMLMDLVQRWIVVCDYIMLR